MRLAYQPEGCKNESAHCPVSPPTCPAQAAHMGSGAGGGSHWAIIKNSKLQTLSCLHLCAENNTPQTNLKMGYRSVLLSVGPLREMGSYTHIWPCRLTSDPAPSIYCLRRMYIDAQPAKRAYIREFHRFCRRFTHPPPLLMCLSPQ